MQTISVAAAIIERDGHVLACQRGSGDMAGGWEFPGGKVEPGESAEQACRREIREELGCELGACALFSVVEHDYPSFHLSMQCFTTSVAPGSEPRMLEHSDMRWLSQGEIADVDWLPADAGLVRDLAMAWDQVFSSEPY